MTSRPRPLTPNQADLWLNHIRKLTRSGRTSTVGRRNPAIAAKSKDVARRITSNVRSLPDIERLARFIGSTHRTVDEKRLLFEEHLYEFRRLVMDLANVSYRARRQGHVAASLVDLNDHDQTVVCHRLWQDFVHLSDRVQSTDATYRLTELPVLFISGQAYDEIREQFPELDDATFSSIVLKHKTDPAGAARRMSSRLEKLRPYESELTPYETRRLARSTLPDVESVAQKLVDTLPVMRDMFPEMADYDRVHVAISNLDDPLGAAENTMALARALHDVSPRTSLKVATRQAATSPLKTAKIVAGKKSTPQHEPQRNGSLENRPTPKRATRRTQTLSLDTSEVRHTDETSLSPSVLGGRQLPAGHDVVDRSDNELGESASTPTLDRHTDYASSAKAADTESRFDTHRDGTPDNRALEPPSL